MTHATRRLRIAALSIVALAAAACGPTVSSATPSSPASASSTPISSPSDATPTSSALASASASPRSSAATTCPAMPQSVALPSDRFTDLKVDPGPSSDRLTFVFGNASLPGPASPPEGTLDVVSPPYTRAGSGASVTMTGDHVIAIRLAGMSLQNDAGEETYAGPAALHPNLPALRDAVLYDASEGVVGWYVGYDGTGCVTLGRDGNTITVSIDHS
jgi:hypothetical protein